MQRLTTITLDLDDTLWAIAPVIERAERALTDWLAERYPRIATRFDAADIAALRASIVDEHRAMAHDLKFLRRTVLERMALAAGYDASLVDPAFRVFDEHRNSVTLYPDVAPALERLGDRYRLVALTNGNANLERIGIRHLFADVVTAAEAGVAKPDAAIFELACKRAGARRDEVLHVGDHPEIDVAGARAAGLAAAWVNRHDVDWPESLAPPDATVRSMEELAAWLGHG